MPITLPIHFNRLTRDEFHDLDYRVMEHAFASQNDLGRFCDEAIYQTDLALRLRAGGIGPVRTELPVTVTWRDFTKTYFLDLVVGDAVIYELKTAVALSGDHESQLLNYLLLAEVGHGKLVNFRPSAVEKRFVTTTLTLNDRRTFRLHTDNWEPLTPACARIATVLRELLADWGAYLQLRLYEEALAWFLGGEERILRPVPLNRDGVALGNQALHQHADGVAFRLTATTEHRDRVEPHLRRFLAHTRLRAIQWLNFNHADIELTTLRRQDG